MTVQPKLEVQLYALGHYPLVWLNISDLSVNPNPDILAVFKIMDGDVESLNFINYTNIIIIEFYASM